MEPFVELVLREGDPSTRYKLALAGLGGGGAVDDVYLAPILMIAGRARIHASLEGNALDAVLALGLADQRVDAPAARLVESQWADGGWNCDRAPSASHSSLETLLPLRGL